LKYAQQLNECNCWIQYIRSLKILSSSKCSGESYVGIHVGLEKADREILRSGHCGRIVLSGTLFILLLEKHLAVILHRH
jgi:hypothetical protein